VDDPSAPVRLDRWLWAARLVKTRAVAAAAIRGGRVHVDGRAVKPSREVRPGDRVALSADGPRREVVVLRTAERRGPASEAALLYEETPESRGARERHAAERRAARDAGLGPPGGPRPTKRDRRRLERARGSPRRET
jgi:ribosome-associated heat shock protein Hsp15